MILIEKNSELFELHKKAMVKKMKDEIKDKILKFVYVTISKEDIFITPTIRKLLCYFEKNIEKFILSNISVQKLLINEVFLKDATLTKKYKNKEKRSDSYKIIRYIFETRGYNEFTKGFTYNGNEYGAYKFVGLLNLKTCPYCNRNYISMIEKEVRYDKQRRPELDHFHPKSIYPFLAVNYYNLIPSCSTCNKLKSDDDSLRLLHPYDKKVKDIKVTYWINDMKFYNVKSLKDLTLDSVKSIDIEIDIPIENKRIFQLERLYQEHKDIVIELILKHLHYPSSYIKELSDFGYSKNEIYRFLFSNYLDENEFSKRPLAKLTRDIAEELGLLDYMVDVNITS